MRRPTPLLALLLAAGCGGNDGAPPPPPPGPLVAEPLLATLAGGPLRITGNGFGEPGDGSSLALSCGISISSRDAAVVWKDDSIAAVLPESARGGTLAVVTPAGRSAEVPLEIYAYDSFPVPPTPGTNASPLAVALDATGRVWILSEFHKNEFHAYDPSLDKVVAVAIPSPPAPGPYATTIFGDHRTDISACGEDVIVDPRGRVWFTQGGGYLYDGKHPNHSRVVCFEPEGKRFRVYNVPGDRNEVIGIAWDERRGRIWFAQGGLTAGARIWWFDPETAPFDDAFDFSRELDPAAQGFGFFDLPTRDAQPAHLAVDADGSVWYSAFWRNRVGRLDPETGEVREVLLPPGIGTSKPGKLVGGGPWSIHVRPDGTVVFNEFFDSTLTRIDAALVRAGDPSRYALDSEGRNPCILDALVLPDADLEREQIHSCAYDAAGRLWFTIHCENAPGMRPSLGFVTADWKRVVRLPTLPQKPGDPPSAANGLAVDPRTGDVWFAEYWTHRLGRLRRR
jgi:streptogramin lyase